MNSLNPSENRAQVDAYVASEPEVWRGYTRAFVWTVVAWAIGLGVTLIQGWVTGSETFDGLLIAVASLGIATLAAAPAFWFCSTRAKKRPRAVTTAPSRSNGLTSPSNAVTGRQPTETHNSQTAEINHYVSASESLEQDGDSGQQSFAGRSTEGQSEQDAKTLLPADPDEIATIAHRPDTISQRLIGVWMWGMAIRSVGTVALFLSCRYQLASSTETIALLTITWYVWLTAVEVTCVARLTPKSVVPPQFAETSFG